MAILLAAGVLSAGEGERQYKAYVCIFDFECNEAKYGKKLAEAVRAKLRRHKDFWVLDRLSTAEASDEAGFNADRRKLGTLMREKIGVNLGVFGTVQKDGTLVRATLGCIDLRGEGDARKPGGWEKVFSDDSERANAVIARAIVEAITGKREWSPPEYGDESEPEDFGAPLNPNGTFEAGNRGWEPFDNVGHMLIDGPKGRGKILKVRTDLKRDPWLAYRRALRLGKASPKDPPKIGRDTSYACVGGLEGVHVRSEWIPAAAGQRYWLTADRKGLGGAKVFVKGFKKTPHAMDGLPESSLAKLGLTPRRFAELPEAKRKALIRKEIERDPMNFLRECYRWYLNCGEQSAATKAGENGWAHYAAPFPPRGGLPEDVEYLQVQIYSYWPPGTYLWDNVHLYKDPRQKDPLKEVKPRTPNYGKTSDVVEKEYIRKHGKDYEGTPATAPTQ